MSRFGFRYLLTRLENNQPTLASLQQTIEDIKAVLAASNVPVPVGLAELHRSGTFKIVDEVAGGKIETILMARAENAGAVGLSRRRGTLGPEARRENDAQKQKSASVVGIGASELPREGCRKASLLARSNANRGSD